MALRASRRRGRGGPGDFSWIQLVADSLVRPRAAAPEVLGLRIGWRPLAEAGIAVAAIGVVLNYVAMQVGGGGVDPISASVLERPVLGATIQAALMVGVIWLTHRLGKAFGGAGDLHGAAIAVVWLNAVTLFLQAAQIFALAFAPTLASLVAVGTFFWLLWAYANFAAELHRFDSVVMVLGVTILALVAIVFGLTMLAAILGFVPQGT